MKVIRNVIAVGEVINLRDFIPSDAESIATYCRDPHVVRYVLIPQPYNLTDSVGYIRRTRRANKAKSSMSFAIEEPESKEVIGGVSLMNLSAAHRRAEIAYILSRRFWNKGFMSEAVSLMLQYGFESMQLHRIYARALGPNLPSMKVLKKCGFTHEGVQRRALFHRRHWYDEHMFGILKKEYVLHSRSADRTK